MHRSCIGHLNTDTWLFSEVTTQEAGVSTVDALDVNNHVDVTDASAENNAVSNVTDLEVETVGPYSNDMMDCGDDGPAVEQRDRMGNEGIENQTRGERVMLGYTNEVN